VQGTYIGQTNGNRATYRFPKPGSAYGTNIKVVYSNGGTWTIPNGASDLKNFKSDSAKSTGIKPKWEMTPENYGGRSDLKFHHWNWNARRIGKAYAMVTWPNTNGAEWVEVGGHRMEKYGSQDDGRDVWTMGSLKQSGTLVGRIKFRGKIYTFKIPRGQQIVRDINFFGSGKPTSKPTNKPTRPTSGSTGSDDQYGSEGGDEGGWADTQPGAGNGWGGDTQPGGAPSGGHHGNAPGDSTGETPDTGPGPENR
jgi:hypothetical protein